MRVIFILSHILLPSMPRWKVHWRKQLLENMHIVTEDVKDIVQHVKEDLEESELLTELKIVKNVYM